MSVDYSAHPTKDRMLIDSPSKGPLLQKENIAFSLIEEDSGFEIFEKDYEALAAFENCSVNDAKKRYSHIEINWSNDEDKGYVQILIYDHYVQIHTGGGESGLPPLMTVMEVLEGHELFVFDPQNDSWLS